MQVDLQNIEDTIFELREHYPSIGHWPKKVRGDSKQKPSFTFDHWNSAFTIQRMKQKRMNVEDEQWSRPFQVDVYRNARSQFYNSLVSLPDTPSITSKNSMSPGAIYELERLEFIDGSKVDHPEGGSKDTADAVVRVIQHCTEAGTSKFAFTHAYGNKSMYEPHGPFIPNPNPTVNPAATPGISQAMRDAEEERLRERPPGELTPASAPGGRRSMAGRGGSGDRVARRHAASARIAAAIGRPRERTALDCRRACADDPRGDEGSELPGDPARDNGGPLHPMAAQRVRRDPGDCARLRGDPRADESDARRPRADRGHDRGLARRDRPMVTPHRAHPPEGH
jgi:hypothetical protein